MRMNRKAALAVGASFGMAFLAACSDSPVGPAANMAPSVPSLAVGDAATATPVPGKLIVCKEGNIGGDFTIARTSGSGSFDSDGLHLNSGQCVVVAEDNSPQGSGSVFRVHEVDAANVTYVVSGQAVEIGFPPTALVGPTDNQDFFINSIHGIRVTYTNTFTPPPTGCTYTKGWYQSKNATLTGVDGLTVDVEAAFFAAQPKNTGSVSFVGPNNLLNLYQQLLAALENGGAAGPQAVQDAIADAQAGTTVTGTELTTTLTNTEISDLIDTLSAFNEGTFEGWPHC
jgi:hypothetical protein